MQNGTAITCAELNTLRMQYEATGEKVETQLHCEPLDDEEERISWRKRCILNPYKPWESTKRSNVELTGSVQVHRPESE